MGHQEKVNFTPINTVYEKIHEEHTSVSCYFTDQVHLAYRSYKYLGNVPFTVYFDFETTTSDAVIFDPKNVRYKLLSNIFISP